MLALLVVLRLALVALRLFRVALFTFLFLALIGLFRLLVAGFVLILRLRLVPLRFLLLLLLVLRIFLLFVFVVAAFRLLLVRVVLFLVLLLVGLLVLGFRWILFLQLVDQPLHEVAVVFCVLVARLHIQRLVVMLERILPFLDLRLLVLLRRAALVKGVAEIVFRRRAELRISRGHGFGESLQRLAIIALFVGRRAFVEMQRLRPRHAIELLRKNFRRALVVLAFVGFHARVFRPRAGRHKTACQQQRDHRPRLRRLCAAPLPLADEHRRSQQHQPGGERPLVALDRTARSLGVDVLFFHLSESVADDLQRLRRAGFEANIKASGRFCNFPEPALIEPRFHKLPALVLHKSRPAIRPRHRDERPIRRADADGKNAHRALQRLGGFHRVVVQLLAIGEKDERPVIALAFAKGLDRRLDRRRDIRAAERDDLGAEFLQRIEHGGVIHGQRRLQKRAPRKRDQPRAIAAELADQILRRQPRAPEPVRREVGSEHAF